MTVILTGAGSGGHITPLLAVAAELKRQDPDIKIAFIGQRGDKLADLPANNPSIDKVYVVRAGKFRRYHGEGLKQFLDVTTLLKNFRDAVYAIIGIWQSRQLLNKIRPDIIFIKGGFVGVPVGLAAASLHLPFVTHDSDAIPGLANRIIARWATLHTVALPKNIYPYPAGKTITTGIPLQADFVPVTADKQRKYRSQIDVPENSKLLFIIGGGLGSQTVNQAVAEAVPHLLREFRDLYIIHVVGRANESHMKSFYDQSVEPLDLGRIQLHGFVSDVFRYSGAADIIVTRAGATNLAEFSLQGKACIVIPSSFLTGGHQLKNAQYLTDHQAAEVLTDTELAADPNRLARQVSDLLQNPGKCRELGLNLAAFAKPNATRELAQILLDQIQKFAAAGSSE